MVPGTFIFSSVGMMNAYWRGSPVWLPSDMTSVRLERNRKVNRGFVQQAQFSYKLSWSSVHLAPVADPHHPDDQLPILDLANEAVIADTIPPFLGISLECFPAEAQID
jgi:hypothetical protein